MRIKTQLFRQLMPILNMAKDGLHLDFRKKKCFMVGQGFFGVVDLEGSVDEVLDEVICIPDLSYFTGPVQTYDELEWKRSSFFHGKNKFTIPLSMPQSFQNTLEAESLSALALDDSTPHVSITNTIRGAVKVARVFTVPSYGIVFGKHGILGSDRKKAYLYGPLEEPVPECSFPTQFVPILDTPNTDFKAYILATGTHMNKMVLTLLPKGESKAYAAFVFEISLSYESILNIPNQVVAKYPEYFILEQSDIENLVKLAKPIAREADGLKIVLTYSPESSTLNAELNFAAKNVDYRFEIKVLESSIQKKQVFKFYYANFESAVNIWSSSSTPNTRMSFFYLQDGRCSPAVLFDSVKDPTHKALLTQLRIGGSEDAVK